MYYAAMFYMTTSAIKETGIYKSHYKKSYHNTPLNCEKLLYRNVTQVLENTICQL